MKLTIAGVREYTQNTKHLQLTTIEAGNLDYGKGVGRNVIRILNGSGTSCADIDVVDLVGWLKLNAPELLK